MEQKPDPALGSDAFRLLWGVHEECGTDISIKTLCYRNKFQSKRGFLSTKNTCNWHVCVDWEKGFLSATNR